MNISSIAMPLPGYTKLDLFRPFNSFIETEPLDIHQYEALANSPVSDGAEILFSGELTEEGITVLNLFKNNNVILKSDISQAKYFSQLPDVFHEESMVVLDLSADIIKSMLAKDTENLMEVTSDLIANNIEVAFDLTLDSKNIDVAEEVLSFCKKAQINLSISFLETEEASDFAEKLLAIQLKYDIQLPLFEDIRTASKSLAITRNYAYSCMSSVNPPLTSFQVLLSMGDLAPVILNRLFSQESEEPQLYVTDSVMYNILIDNLAKKIEEEKK